MVNPKPVKLVAGSANNDSVFEPESLKVIGFDAAALVPTATASVAGLVKRAPAQANSTATDVPGLVTDFNALLAKLRTAGIVAP